MLNGQQPQLDGRLEVAVTLPINTWNVILMMISKQPWEQADPLLGELHRQIKGALAAREEAQASTLAKEH